jgi:hypothetical protein
MTATKSEVATMKSEMETMKLEMAAMKSEMAEVKSEMETMKSDIKSDILVTLVEMAAPLSGPRPRLPFQAF